MEGDNWNICLGMVLERRFQLNHILGQTSNSDLDLIPSLSSIIWMLIYMLLEAETIFLMLGCSFKDTYSLLLVQMLLSTCLAVLLLFYIFLNRRKLINLDLKHYSLRLNSADNVMMVMFRKRTD